VPCVTLGAQSAASPIGAIPSRRRVGQGSAQPIAFVTSVGAVGVKALTRWDMPGFGELPTDLVPFEAPRLVELTYRTIRAARTWNWSPLPSATTGWLRSLRP
jgi:hypothetical protein